MATMWDSAALSIYLSTSKSPTCWTTWATTNSNCQKTCEWTMFSGAFRKARSQFGSPDHSRQLFSRATPVQSVSPSFADLTTHLDSSNSSPWQLSLTRTSLQPSSPPSSSPTGSKTTWARCTRPHRRRSRLSHSACGKPPSKKTTSTTITTWCFCRRRKKPNWEINPP